MWLHGDAKPPILRAGSNWEGIFSSPQEPHDAQQADEETGLWSFDRDTRRKMWDTWVKEIRNERVESLARHIEHYNTDARELTELQLQRDIERVKQARVVGCTTTGAAIHQALLQEAACGVVLVEEAAEVLEAHVLTALGPATRHAIMIGEGSHASGVSLWLTHLYSILHVGALNSRAWQSFLVLHNCPKSCTPLHCVKTIFDSLGAQQFSLGIMFWSLSMWRPHGFNALCVAIPRRVGAMCS